MKFLFAVLAVLLVAGCTQTPPPVLEPGRQVNFTTVDGFVISGTLYENPGKPAVILAHMLGGDRSQWDGIVPFLAQKYAVLAIDLRGHGKSLKQSGQTRTWGTFLDPDFQKMALDIEAARAYLEQEAGVDEFAVIGASIGANAALQAATDSSIANVALLSPGIEYRGVTTLDAVQAYHGQLFIAASADDPYSADSANQLYVASPLPVEQKQLLMLESAGHGTAMLFQENLNPVLISWLENNL